MFSFLLVCVIIALGRLAKASDNLTSDSLEFEISRALDRLKGERHELRRYGAVLVLKELAVNAPSLFNQHSKDFFTLIWTGIRDIKVTGESFVVWAVEFFVMRFRCTAEHSRSVYRSPSRSASVD